ncbi:MAG: arsenate reductase (glutaredoxin) [Calditrichia bacterium]
MSIIIWHNPRCRKSREGLSYLESKGVQPVIFKYLEEPFEASTLAEIIRKSNQEVTEFIRSNEADFKALGVKKKDLTPDSFAELASKYPKILQRPIVVNGDKAVLARPAEKIDEIL